MIEGKVYAPNPISTGFILVRAVCMEAGTFFGFGTRSAAESNLMVLDTSKGKFKLEATEEEEFCEFCEFCEIDELKPLAPERSELNGFEPILILLSRGIFPPTLLYIYDDY